MLDLLPHVVPDLLLDLFGRLGVRPLPPVVVELVADVDKVRVVRQFHVERPVGRRDVNVHLPGHGVLLTF